VWKCKQRKKGNTFQRVGKRDREKPTEGKGKSARKTSFQTAGKLLLERRFCPYGKGGRDGRDVDLMKFALIRHMEEIHLLHIAEI
jgi:hypothetical protein